MNKQHLKKEMSNRYLYEYLFWSHYFSCKDMKRILKIHNFIFT